MTREEEGEKYKSSMRVAEGEGINFLIACETRKLFPTVSRTLFDVPARAVSNSVVAHDRLSDIGRDKES